MHSNANMQKPMRTTVELSDRTYTRLRARAAERGMRGFSAIVEEALDRLFEQRGGDDLRSAVMEAEGTWGESDVEEWERARKEAWGAWPTSPY